MSAFALCGCASTQRVEMIKIGPFTLGVPPDDGFDVGATTTVKLPDSSLVRVWINPNGQIILDQEPIRPNVDPTLSVKVLWFLPKPASGQGYNFPRCVPTNPCSAISFDQSTGSPTNFQCATLQGSVRRGLYCVYMAASQTSVDRWKYSLTVLDPNNQPVTTLDPWISQN